MREQEHLMRTSSSL